MYNVKVHMAVFLSLHAVVGIGIQVIPFFRVPLSIMLGYTDSLEKSDWLYCDVNHIVP